MINYKKRDKKGSFARYKNEVLDMSDRVSCFNLYDLTPRQVELLSGLIGNILVVFQTLQAERFKTSDMKKFKMRLKGKE